MVDHKLLFWKKRTHVTISFALSSATEKARRLKRRFAHL